MLQCDYMYFIMVTSVRTFYNMYEFSKRAATTQSEHVTNIAKVIMKQIVVVRFSLLSFQRFLRFSKLFSIIRSAYLVFFNFRSFHPFFFIFSSSLFIQRIQIFYSIFISFYDTSFTTSQQLFTIFLFIYRSITL